MAVSSGVSIFAFMVKINTLPINMAVSSGGSIFSFTVKISPLPLIMAVRSGVSIYGKNKLIANYNGRQ